MIQGSKGHIYHASMTNMTLEPTKYETTAIFHRKMNGFRMFLIPRVQSAAKSVYHRDKMPFAPNIIFIL